ncbi:hypothetical protein DPM19_12540 [Actinomadura craniellae]|uniref:Subtilisin inhibitor domain-containing protein n=1 Tax=Actinomadura craniellae TaxID=2231787 RepID=A0A365H6G6_9ACTN|nr:SSI family serine proteinase inhibitor [Actinomadura craniellae]RAY14592.1 hypothetical protein DPM19_12540 [Actinomadura craniellae]
MRYLLFALTASALVLTGCGGDDEAGTSPTAVSPTPAGASKLTVQVRESASAKPRTWTLTCDPAGGDHPAAAQSCAALARAGRWYEPVPPSQMCTEIYGGPQSATVTGTWRGETVNASFNRKNGCEISRWSKIAPTLGAT